MQNESIKTMSLELFQGICSILVPSKGNKGKSSAVSLVVLGDFDTSDFSEAFHKDAEVNFSCGWRNIHENLLGIPNGGIAGRRSADGGVRKGGSSVVGNRG
jgi:hypothetical protein